MQLSFYVGYAADIIEKIRAAERGDIGATKGQLAPGPKPTRRPKFKK